MPKDMMLQGPRRAERVADLLVMGAACKQVKLERAHFFATGFVSRGRPSVEDGARIVTCSRFVPTLAANWRQETTLGRVEKRWE